MVPKEKLYEAFGELIYAVAKADGIVQGEETAILEGILQNHSWASEILWSFNYETQKNHPVEHVYAKALDVFKEHGPDREYAYFVEVLQLVAESSEGVVDNEEKVISQFQQDLVRQFKADLNVI